MALIWQRFRITIAVSRIGLTGGGVVFDQDDSAFAQALGASSAEYLEPVGWVDLQTLLVEVVIEDYGNPSIVKG